MKSGALNKFRYWYWYWGRGTLYRIYATIKTRRLSETEVGVADCTWSTHAECRKADLNWKL